MSKIRVPNRIRAEDFKQEFREIADKLSGINNFQDDVVSLINDGRLDFDNMNRQKAIIDVNTGISGDITAQPQIRLTLKTKPYGINVVNISNVNSPGTYPNYLPLLVFTFNDTILTITSIKGLTASAKYKIYLEIIGT